MVTKLGMLQAMVGNSGAIQSLLLHAPMLSLLVIEGTGTSNYHLLPKTESSLPLAFDFSAAGGVTLMFCPPFSEYA